MISHWIMSTVLVVWIASTIYVVADTIADGPAVDTSAANGQMPNPVGASRVFPKTSFTCKNRPAGYYADVETGCQVYHMCDGVGRQFSYACPNTTLFQQRMLICDHWYMVNCSKAENDYAANLLIGQKDKPFVPENEHQQRTPRPDLLDRPYAPDYSGESFRNNYKDLPPIQNHISESYRSKELSKPLPTRWSLKNSLKSKGNSVYSNRRSDEVDDSDLGTSFSTRYNSTGDISSEQNSNSHFHKTTESNTIIEVNKTKPTKFKVPSKVYEPPFLQPNYNENYTNEPTNTKTLEKPATTSTTTTTTTTTQAPRTSTTLKTTPAAEITRPSFVARPFDFISSTAPTPVKSNENRNSYDFSNVLQQNGPLIRKQQQTTPRQTVTDDDRSEENFTGPTSSFESKKHEKIPFGLPAEFNRPEVPYPNRDLLPPFAEYVIHDVATTQGPPIYYEWKTPSDSLEPPKLPVEATSGSASSTDLTPEPSTTQPSFIHNPFLSSLLRTKNSPSNGGSSFGDSDTKATTNSEKGPKPIRRFIPEYPTDQKIEELQRELLIPDFLFPLENEGRTGYELDDTLDSFQLRIPRKRNVNRHSRYIRRSLTGKRQ